jgi:hypothetical protein
MKQVFKALFRVIATPPHVWCARPGFAEWLRNNAGKM